jgi:hypothetical protein
MLSKIVLERRYATLYRWANLWLSGGTENGPTSQRDPETVNSSPRVQGQV